MSQVASPGNWWPFVLAVVDQVINEIIAYDKMLLINLFHCDIYFAFNIFNSILFSFVMCIISTKT